MDEGGALSLDSCVVAWLRDVRHFVELECSSILLAKSILPSKSAILKNSTDFLNTSSDFLSIPLNIESQPKFGEDSELIIGGRISIDPSSSTMDDTYDFTEFNKKFTKTSMYSKNADFKQKRNAFSLTHLNYRPLEQFQEESNSKSNYDDSSLDSACGSSPIFSSGDSPLRTSSPINERRGKMSFIKPADFMFLPSYLNAKSNTLLSKATST